MSASSRRLLTASVALATLVVGATPSTAIAQFGGLPGTSGDTVRVGGRGGPGRPSEPPLPPACPIDPGNHEACIGWPPVHGNSSVDGPFAAPEGVTAQSDWSIVASPNLQATQTNNVLTDMTCVSESECWAVGYGGSQSLIERWNGSSWAITPSSNAGGSNLLYGVACVSAADCWAVGSSYADGRWNTLVERWDGSSWSTLPSPNADAVNNTLRDVTCTSTSACWAVGWSYDNTGGVSKTLIERWDGTSWSIVPSPGALNNNPSHLTAVTCASASDCWAVGFSRDAGYRNQALIERWNGVAWTLFASGEIPWLLGDETWLNEVTCVSALDCWAVGAYGISGESPRTLIQRWNGLVWQADPSANAGDGVNVLTAVICASQSSCWAVGASYANGYKALIERWDGTSWSIVPTPETHDNALTAVTCVSPSSCWAVGYSGRGLLQTLIERWDGSSWAIVPSANMTRIGAQTDNHLSGVTCPSASDCWAVGYYWDGVQQSLVERWDGGSWTVVPSPNANAHRVLYDVTCTSTSDCWAVGYSYTNRYTTLIQRWDGRSWAIIPSPNASGADLLYDVTCVSAADCWAVGESFESGGDSNSLIARWNGTSWVIVASPNVGRANALYSVTCVSGSDCWSAGTYYAGCYFVVNGSCSFGYSDARTLIQRWDGASWAVVPSPNGSNRRWNELLDVACVSASECWAVGYLWDDEDDVYKALIERWDGASWSMDPLPPADGPHDRFLYGVTCVASDCWAVGESYDYENDVSTNLVERWDGTSWTIVPSPNAVEAQYNVLSDVACVSASDCLAVGSSSVDDVWSTLVASYSPP